MSIAKFSVENSKLINMIMVVVFIFGIYTMINMPKEEMPAVEFGAFYISVSYRGVSPAEMEQLVVKPIEDKLVNLDDVDYITSTCREGLAIIYVQMLPNADMDEGWDELNTEMDKVNDLPEDATDPVLVRLNMREVNSICTVSMGGDLSDNTLRELAEDLKEELLNVEDVSKVDISGTRDRQIWVEADTARMDQYGITLNDLISSINYRNMNVPAGTIKFGRAEFIIRTVGEFESVTQIANLVLRMDSNGRATLVKDIATVSDTLEERTTIAKLDGKPSVNLRVYQRADGNIVTIMRDVRAVAEEFPNRVDGLKVEVRNDGSKRVKSSMNTLGNNALMGIILVFITLTIFIGWKNALFAAWGIPFSFFLGFILMRQMDITMNNLSLFAMILVLGMIVDDAIIVLENIHRHREMGASLKEAAIKGTEEIMWPVIAAVTTTIAAFLPMLMMKGTMGKFMSLFPIVVSLALAASLFEALIILPSHAAELGGKKQRKRNGTNKITKWLQKKYKKAARWALCHRTWVIIFVILALLFSASTVVLRLVKFEFFPRHSVSTLSMKLSTPVGTNLDKTNEVITQIEEYIINMEESEDIEALVTVVGQYRENHRNKVETSNAEIRMDFKDADEMKYSQDEIKRKIRKYLSELPGLYEFSMREGRGGPPTGEDLELRIIGDDMDKLDEIGQFIISELGKIPGVTDIESSFEEGKKEIQIVPYNEKISMYGLTVRDIASTISTASYGTTVSKYRGTGLDEYDIVVRVKEKQIDTLDELENLKIRTRTGDLIPIKELAEFRIVQGFSEIQHRDGKRVNTITGSTGIYMDGNRKRKRTPDEVTQILIGNRLTGEIGILTDFDEKFPGYRLEYGGVKEEQTKSYNSLYMAFIVALLLVFTILATQFKSWVQPLIVMMTIPFSIIGVILGLLITRLPFSLMTLISVLALAGVVVNDSLVLVDFVNKERESGTDRWNSLINAGATRLRPILLTTITTIAGFMPIIISSASEVQDWKPMAVSIAFGLAFATTLTLFVIPVIYSVVDSIFGRLGMTRFKEHMSFKDAMKICDAIKIEEDKD